MATHEIASRMLARSGQVADAEPVIPGIRPLEPRSNSHGLRIGGIRHTRKARQGDRKRSENHNCRVEDASPERRIVEVAKMPAQHAELNRSQCFPFLDFIGIVFAEQLDDDFLDLFSEWRVHHVHFTMPWDFHC